MTQFKKTKLELTWIGKENRPRLEPRILLEDPEKSYHAEHRVTDHDVFDNRLIFGDNLLALKALEQEFTGKIKCIYIDPPYNTGSAFEHYDDGIEHSVWLSMMRERLALLWGLLSSNNGVLLISINDDEAHYLKVLCDELFGRDKFINSLVWFYEGNTDNQAKIINYHEYVLVFSKSGTIDAPGVIDPNIDASSKLYRPEIRNTVVKNGPANPVSPVMLPKGFPASFDEGLIPVDAAEWPKLSNAVSVRAGRTETAVTASSGWASKKILSAFIAQKFQPVLDTKGQATRFEITKTGAIEAVKDRKQEKGHFISVLRGFGTTNQMRILLEKLGVNFTFPKPVGLISYLIEAFSGPNDIILDSFAGSGTTGHAVQDLNLRTGSQRRFILIEVEADTVELVTIPRLRAVVSGNANAGVPAHGGGFRFYKLAPSLLEMDKWGQWVISSEFNAAMLAEAACKLEGFTYAPSDTVYWQHGHSTERDFIYVTTQQLSADQLAQLSDEVGSERSLLVLCAAFRVPKGGTERYANLTVKKIPKQVLSRCEWGHDDYSLKVENLPKAPPPPPKADKRGQIDLI
jgi:adenine-specific DNA-methyltransferase